MYAPRAFKVEDAEATFDFVARNGFATLIAVEGGGAVVSHLPLLADRRRGVLRGHLARANPHAALIDGRRQTAVFMGADAYVSPDWYGDAEQVPTWNYSTVHVAGAARALTEAADVDALLEELSDHHERRRHDLANGRIWKLSKLPQEKLRKMRAAIVAFEIDIEEMAFKAKLSQNKDADDFQSVMAKLSSGDESQRAVAEDMRAVLK
jgi:transcriptional regulator